MEEKEAQELIKKYEPMMHKLLKRFKIKRDYEDTLQELRLVTWKIIDSHNIEKSTFTTFVYNCLKNYLINRLVVEKKYQKIEKDATRTLNEQIPYNLSNPGYIGDMTFEQQISILTGGNSADGIRLGIDLKIFKESLNERDQKILALKELGFKQREIAKDLNIVRTTVGRRLKNIKNKFKSYMKEGQLW